MKYKNALLVLSLSLILSSCTDKSEEKVKDESQIQKKVANVAKAGSIEVVKNDDAYEKKVENKEVTKDRSYYYSYNKEEKDTKARTQVDANMHIRSPYEKVEISMLVGSLSKDFIVKCSSCHNDYANGIIGPSLLQKDAKFIEDSILSFKKDFNKNILMSELVKQLSKEEITRLSKEIAVFNKKIKELKAK